MSKKRQKSFRMVTNLKKVIKSSASLITFVINTLIFCGNQDRMFLNVSLFTVLLWTAGAGRAGSLNRAWKESRLQKVCVCVCAFMTHHLLFNNLVKAVQKRQHAHFSARVSQLVVSVEAQTKFNCQITHAVIYTNSFFLLWQTDSRSHETTRPRPL